MRSKRVHLSLLVAFASTLAFSQAAAADRQPVSYNAADQAAARAAVLKKADLAVAAGWTGGMTKPDFTPSPCGGYEPKSSDLLVTGAAESRWKHTSGTTFVTEAWVLRTSAMLKLDWQRSVTRPGYLTCVLRKQFAAADTKIVSLKQIPFPKLAPLTRRYRLLVDYTTQAGPIRMMFDIILISKGRTELSIVAIAPYGAGAAVEATQLRIARKLAARATA